MSRYRRANTPGASYFFTVVAYRRQPILCDAPIRAALRDTIQQARTRRLFTIDAWVLLPYHLHCLWTQPPGYADFATRVRESLANERVGTACPPYLAGIGAFVSIGEGAVALNKNDYYGVGTAEANLIIGVSTAATGYGGWAIGVGYFGAEVTGLKGKAVGPITDLFCYSLGGC